VAGEEKTSQQKDRDYQQDLREMETMLGFFREELEMAIHNIDQKVTYNSNQIFIVHGHDMSSKNELARIIDKEFNLESIISHEQPDQGKTIIEKLERDSRLPGYAFVLLTPDDIGAKRQPNEDIEHFNRPDMKLQEQETKFNYRARQNVILELGFFIGLLSRERVCCLYKGGVELPSDFAGVLHKEFNKTISEITWKIRKELKAAGYNV
jgi:predicted nucleotide-binding protein